MNIRRYLLGIVLLIGSHGLCARADSYYADEATSAEPIRSDGELAAKKHDLYKRHHQDLDKIHADTFKTEAEKVEARRALDEKIDNIRLNLESRREAGKGIMLSANSDAEPIKTVVASATPEVASATFATQENFDGTVNRPHAQPAEVTATFALPKGAPAKPGMFDGWKKKMGDVRDKVSDNLKKLKDKATAQVKRVKDHLTGRDEVTQNKIRENASELKGFTRDENIANKKSGASWWSKFKDWKDFYSTSAQREVYSEMDTQSLKEFVSLGRFNDAPVEALISRAEPKYRAKLLKSFKVARDARLQYRKVHKPLHMDTTDFMRVSKLHDNMLQVNGDFQKLIQSSFPPYK